MATTTTSTIELTAVSTPPDTASVADGARAEDGEASPHPARQEFSLPPVDGGKDAWLFLAASFFVEALVWGELPLNWMDGRCGRSGS